jgi:hypothetical protein
MEKFVVGQEVKVRSDLIAGNDYGFYFNEDMSELKGEELVIVRIDKNEIFMKDSNWTWHEEMLEPVEVAEPLVESKVLVLERTSKFEIYVERVIVNDPATIMFYKVANYDYATGTFKEWSDTKKIVAKCNKEFGDKFDVGKGVEVAMLLAYRKEIDKLLRKV